VRARRLLEREGPFDRVVAHWLLPCAWPIAARVRGELEAVAHGSDVRVLAALPAALRQHIARVWIRQQIRVRCVSNELRDELLECTTPQLAAHTSVEALPLSLQPRPERAAARRSLGIDEQVRLGVLVARLIPEKRVAVALRAVGLLPGVAVVVVGGGPLLAELRQRFPDVRFTGELPRPQALAWIAAADVVISASKREGAPTALREARALGVPVVACAAGDLTERAESDPGVWIA
jgi:glycosyltransferase involved in cell wall biosynthesis